MDRNMIGASSALAILALLAATPTAVMADENDTVCNSVVDGDGEPVLGSEGGSILHAGSGDCSENDGEASVENTDAGDDEAVAVAVPPAIDPLIVYFNVNEDTLDAASEARVDAYADTVMASSPTSVEVVGFVDSSGPADINARLSEARTESVTEALIGSGVPADLVDSTSGKAIPIAVSDTNNRRVVVAPVY